MAANKPWSQKNCQTSGMAAFLPVEVLTSIFRFLSASEIKTAATVCFLWAKAAEDPILWRGVGAVLGTKNELFSEKLLESLNSRGIHRVRFRNISRAAQIVQLCKHLGPNLRQLSVEGCRSVTEDLMVTVAKVTPQLERLNLKRCRQINVSTRVDWIDTCGSIWNRLTELNLNACRDVTDCTVAKVAANFRNLTSLGVSGCKQINTTTWELLAKNARGLVSLDISRSDISDHQLLHLAKIPEFSLREVNVSACKQLTDNGIVGLVKFQPHLTAIRLACVEVTNTSLIAIGRHLQQLQGLDLNSCRQITDAGLRASSRSGGLARLNSLNLYSCYQLSCAALEEFLCSPQEPDAEAPPLQTLVLNGCSSVTDGLVCTFSRVVLRLRELDLSSCIHVSDEGLRAINASLTQLRLLRLSWCANITDKGLMGTAIVHGAPSHTCEANRDHITDQAGAGIERLGNLQLLDLSHCMVVTDEGVQRVCCLKQLSTLNLNMCVEITDQSLHNIATNLRSLRHLALSGCSAITDDGLMAIARDLAHLVSLDVSKCDGITDLSILNLSKHASQLAQLDLSMCAQVTSHGVDELETSLPGLASLQLRYSGAQSPHQSALLT